VAHGGFGDVREGIYNDKQVAIKTLRIYKGEDVQNAKKVSCAGLPASPVTSG